MSSLDIIIVNALVTIYSSNWIDAHAIFLTFNSMTEEIVVSRSKIRGQI